MRRAFGLILMVVLTGFLAIAGLVLLMATSTPPGGVSLALSARPGIPIPAFGCGAAPLAPVRVEDVDGRAVFRIQPTGDIVELEWPPGYRAWLVGDRALVVNAFGDKVFEEGETLIDLGVVPADGGLYRVCIGIGEELRVAR